ncbi:MAG: hypothetical protein L6V93_11875 [Clostridiales bacterium]|nr:MAG: hypothetical protein L6V93_11875 [Clostridiales bacterium]
MKVLLENYDFDVIDLGKDVAPEIIAETAVSEKRADCGIERAYDHHRACNGGNDKACPKG